MQFVDHTICPPALFLQAFPYDCSELGSYSQLRDWYEQVSKPGGRFHKFCSRYPDHAWDLAMGGAAGAVAVIVGMPFDCIKVSKADPEL